MRSGDKAAKRAAKAAARDQDFDRKRQSIPVFFCVPTGQSLATEIYVCPAHHYNHRNIGNFPDDARPDTNWDAPIPCETCGQPAKLRSSGLSKIYRRADTGEIVNSNGRGMPVGAVWDVGEFGYRNGPDGRSLYCMTPGGEWHIDSRASNCTMKSDDVHRCWVRTGRPEDGTLDVGKGGFTCAAGAGSIRSGEPGKPGYYHGFLRKGALRPCKDSS